MFTLITWENENSTPEVREDQSLKFCRNIGTKGGFYKVQIVDQQTAQIEEYK